MGSFQQEKEQTAQLLDEKTANCGNKSKLEEMEEKLNKENSVQKKNKLDMHWDLLDELDKLSSNRFVEFIAITIAVYC